MSSAIGLFILAVTLASEHRQSDARAQTTATVEVGDNWFCAPGDSACQTEDFEDIDITTNINVGDTVQWNWVGGNSHTVTECPGGDLITCPAPTVFDSSPEKTSGNYSFTFTTPGTYSYRCQVHTAAMRGQVIVAAAQTTTPGTATPATATGAPTATATRAASPAVVPAGGGTATDGGFGLLWTMALVLGAGQLLASGGFVLRGARHAASR